MSPDRQPTYPPHYPDRKASAFGAHYFDEPEKALASLGRQVDPLTVPRAHGSRIVHEVRRVHRQLEAAARRVERRDKKNRQQPTTGNDGEVVIPETLSDGGERIARFNQRWGKS